MHFCCTFLEFSNSAMLCSVTAKRLPHSLPVEGFVLGVGVSGVSMQLQSLSHLQPPLATSMLHLSQGPAKRCRTCTFNQVKSLKRVTYDPNMLMLEVSAHK